MVSVPKTGGFYIEQYATREDGTWSKPRIAIGNDVFQQPDDADLIALYLEHDGESCPYFLRHGHPLALAAIARA